MQPDAKTKEEFALQIRASHCACDIVLEEVAVFDELHKNGTRHKNALVRSKKQYRWAAVGKHLAETAKMRALVAGHAVELEAVRATAAAAARQADRAESELLEAQEARCEAP